MSLMRYFEKLDSFSRNIMLVFFGTSLISLFNLFYQILIAHRLSPVDFSAFNTLLSILMLVSAPLLTLQAAVAKYSAEYKILNQDNKIKTLFSSFLRQALVISAITFLIFYLFSFYIINNLKINSYASSYLLALLIVLAWFTPIVNGALQGLELFGWFTFVSVIGGIFKLVLAFIFVLGGFGIEGALGAFLAAAALGVFIAFWPLRNFISFKRDRGVVDFGGIYKYLFPVALSNFLLYSLVSIDMVLVRYFFTPDKSGIYSLAQMVGKIFLFLPCAIAVVMFPRTSGLNAKNLDTTQVLKRSLFYAFSLCLAAVVFYNFFPGFVLGVLTGKALPESIVLGRFFSISMSLFTLAFLLINYFLSIGDLRFLKYLVLLSCWQILEILLFHQSLIQVQAIICINAFILLVLFLLLVKKRDEI